jgi:hypothetical protein
MMSVESGDRNRCAQSLPGTSSVTNVSDSRANRWDYRTRWPSVLVLSVFAMVPRTAICDPPNAANWRVVFADEFSGKSVDTLKWATQYNT